MMIGEKLRGLLMLGGGSAHWTRIPRSVKFITWNDRLTSPSLTEVLVNYDGPVLTRSKFVKCSNDPRSDFMLSGGEWWNSREQAQSIGIVIFGSRSRVKEINGFDHCHSLWRVEIPSSVEVIFSHGLWSCPSLTSVIFASNSHLKAIDGIADARSLSRIEIPSSTEAIYRNGFRNCTALHRVIFRSPSHLKDLSGFSQCTSLRRIELPSSLEVISSPGFEQCTSLQKVIFEADSDIQTIDGFSDCTSLRRIQIPSTIHRIDDDGFKGCRSLREVTIGPGNATNEMYCCPFSLCHKMRKIVSVKRVKFSPAFPGRRYFLVLQEKVL
jgi:hypothetical protein